VLKNSVNNDKNIKYICSEFTKNSDTFKITVNIDPNNFINNKINPLNHTNNKWFINLTNATIPTQVPNLIQLGGIFSLPIVMKKSQFMNSLRILKITIVILMIQKKQKYAISLHPFSIN